MLSLLLLVSLLAVTEGADAPSDDVGVNSVPRTLTFDLSAIANQSEESRQEFVNILQNQNITKARMEADIRSWAAKHGILDAVDQAFAKDEQKRENLRANIARAIVEFPATLAKLNAIDDNKSLTTNEADEQKEAFLDTIKTPYLRRLISAVSYPDYAEGEEPLFLTDAH